MIRIASLMFLFLTSQVFSQLKDSTQVYKMNWKIDAPIIVAGLAGTAYGFYLREKKPHTDSAIIVNLDASKFSKINRKATEQDNNAISPISDALLIEGAVIPFALAFDKEIRQDMGKISWMFLETMALTGAGYWMTAGAVDKFRPYTYNKEVPLKRRMNKHSKNSFYGGHPSVTAAGTFFMAQVYNDYHPDKNFKYVMWVIAAGSTLGHAYIRYLGGYHFPSDIAIGVGAGTLIGLAVPILHRNHDYKERNLTISPFQFEDVKGITVRYSIR